MQGMPEPTATIPAALSHFSPEKVREALLKLPFEWREYEPFFGLWLSLVNRNVERRIGLGINDLPDQPFYDFFQDGVTPREAAQMILEEEAGFLFD